VSRNQVTFRTVPVVAAALVAWVLAVSPMPAAGASQTAPSANDPAARVATRAPTTIAPGVTYQRIVDKTIHVRYYVLRFDPLGGASLKAVPAGTRLPAMSKTVPLLKNANAVAGINGDFFAVRRSPQHAFATDGDLLQTRVGGGSNELLGITSPGVVPHVGTTRVQIVLDDPTHLSSWPIDYWNQGGGDPPFSLGSDEVAGYTPYGGDKAVPPGQACSARLINPSGPSWVDPAHSGITRSYTVEEVACADSAMLRQGGTVLSALRSGSVAAEISTLTPGTAVSLTWSLKGWSGITGVIGGNPLIVENGQNTVDQAPCSLPKPPPPPYMLCVPNARTGVGQAADGTIILVVVDVGFQSKGLKLYSFAELFRSLGAVNALNLDGNGSSRMWVNGTTVNQVGDPKRQVSSALAILKGPDPNLPIALAP